MSLQQNIKDLCELFWVVARYRYPDMVLHFGVAPGDDLLCTAVAHELERRKQCVWVCTKYPELFKNNPDIQTTIPIRHRVSHALGLKIKCINYGGKIPGTDRSLIPHEHLIAMLCRQVGVRGKIEIRPYCHLTEAENNTIQKVPNQIAIMSSGVSKAFPMLNKEWYIDRFQQVVDKLKNDFNFIQIGASADPPLNNVLNLCGKTTLRQTAAILRNSLVFVGQVGFLMHLARAVDCRSVVVYGGRESPWQSGYSANVNLVSNLPCAPCWQWNTCDYNRACMNEITSDQVVAGIFKQIEDKNLPLIVDTIMIQDA